MTTIDERLELLGASADMLGAYVAITDEFADLDRVDVWVPAVVAIVIDHAAKAAKVNRDTAVARLLAMCAVLFDSTPDSIVELASVIDDEDTDRLEVPLSLAAPIAGVIEDVAEDKPYSAGMLLTAMLISLVEALNRVTSERKKPAALTH